MTQAMLNGVKTDRLGGKSIEGIVDELATSDPDKLRVFLRRAREVFPEALMRACLRYLATNEEEAKLNVIANSLGHGRDYCEALCDAELLTFVEATRAAQVMRANDPQFMPRFSKVSERLKSDDILALGRALNLVSTFGDYSVLIGWLRGLTMHGSDRIRSKAVKLLCELRPNRGLVEKQLDSPSPRVRANAVESLWRAPNPESLDVFRMALGDAHHRVVVNALIGLYLHGDETAIETMAELARHTSPMFRAAAVWGFGYIHDRRAIPALRVLANDRITGVRSRAAEVLASFPPEPQPEPSIEVQQPAPQRTEAEPAPQNVIEVQPAENEPVPAALAPVPDLAEVLPPPPQAEPIAPAFFLFR